VELPGYFGLPLSTGVNSCRSRMMACPRHPEVIPIFKMLSSKRIEETMRAISFNIY